MTVATCAQQPTTLRPDLHEQTYPIYFKIRLDGNLY